MKYIAVKNFGNHQHYKDRSPKWIKLYNTLLDDYAFLALPEPLQRHLMMIWLIASRHNNRIPGDLAYLARAIHPKGKVDFGALFDAGWLMYVEQDASKPLAEPEQNASRNGAEPEHFAMLEKEIEKEKETTSPLALAKGTPERSPPVPRSKSLVPTPDEEAVLAHYKAKHPRSKPKGDKIIRVIRRALQDYSVPELCSAIDGNLADEWHVANHKHEISYVLRDTEHIDKFRTVDWKSNAPLKETNPALYRAMGGI